MSPLLAHPGQSWRGEAYAAMRFLPGHRSAESTRMCGGRAEEPERTISHLDSTMQVANRTADQHKLAIKHTDDCLACGRDGAKGASSYGF